MIARRSQSFRVHQFHYSVSPSDGISHQLFFIQAALKQIGVSGEIFTSQLVGGIKPPRAFKLNTEKMWDCDLLLIHHSHGNPDLRKLSRIEIPKALMYHNITPAKFYPHDPFLADLSLLGRKQLSALKHEVIATFTASRFNALDLKRHDFPAPQILPLLDLSDELKEVTTKKFHSKKKEPKNILFVGRITRHKNQAQLVKLFFYLKQNLPKNSKLFLVGSQDKVYGDYLKLLIRQLGLGNEVKLTGSVTRKVLEHYYEISDAFVCLSEHEGFCLPLVEAMSRHVPTFFSPVTGVKETMGKSGVALHSEVPFEQAQAIASILNSSRAIKAVLNSQHHRLMELCQEQNKSTIQQLILELVVQLRNNPEIHFERELFKR